MRKLLGIGLAEETFRVLEASAGELGLEVQSSSAEGLFVPASSRGDLEVVLVGGGVDPRNVLQRLRGFLTDVPLLLVASNEKERQAAIEALRYTPHLSASSTCVPSLPDQLVPALAATVGQARKRRAHRETIEALNKKIAAAPPLEARAVGLLGRLLEIAPIGVVITDLAGSVRDTNQRAATLLSPGNDSGGFGAIWDRFTPESSAEIRAQLEKTSDGDRFVRVLETAGSENKLRIEVRVVRLDERSGGPGYLWLLEDITERVALMGQLEQANRRKDEFLAMLGHELRNPLAPILTALELMKLRGNDFEREREIIERQVRHLVELVDDLLDVSRITRGQLELRRTPVEIFDVIAAAIEVARPLFETRRHKLLVDVPRSGLVVHGDRRRLAQVFSNLLTNAAKYTDPGGSVTIEARGRDRELMAVVRDTGRGIPQDLLPHVFEMFVQAPQASDRSAGGLGLGLAIVRSLVERHGGTVAIESEVGRGTAVTVRLPALRATDAPDADFNAGVDRSDAADASPAVPASRAVRVLVVDDNVDAASLLQELLETSGFEVGVAHDGPQAIELTRRFRPNVALLDLGLPVMSGDELARHLRSMPEGTGLQLIAVTGYGQDTDRKRTRQAGFRKHLVKPVRIEDVTAAIEQVLTTDADNEPPPGE